MLLQSQKDSIKQRLVMLKRLRMLSSQTHLNPFNNKNIGLLCSIVFSDFIYTLKGERQFKPQPNQFRNRKNWVRVWARSSWKTQTKTLDRTRKFLFRLFHSPETPINIDSFHSYRRSGTFKWPAFAEIAGKKSDFGPPRFLRRGVCFCNGVTKIL